MSRWMWTAWGVACLAGCTPQDAGTCSVQAQPEPLPPWPVVEHAVGEPWAVEAVVRLDAPLLSAEGSWSGTPSVDSLPGIHATASSWDQWSRATATASAEAYVYIRWPAPDGRTDGLWQRVRPRSGAIRVKHHVGAEVVAEGARLSGSFKASIAAERQLEDRFDWEPFSTRIARTTQGHANPDAPLTSLQTRVTADNPFEVVEHLTRLTSGVAVSVRPAGDATRATVSVDGGPPIDGEEAGEGIWTRVLPVSGTKATVSVEHRIDAEVSATLFPTVTTWLSAHDAAPVSGVLVAPLTMEVVQPADPVQPISVGPYLRSLVGTVEVAVPRMVVPRTLDLGCVPPGEAATGVITIDNDGARALTVRVDTQGSGAFSVPDDTRTLEPGASWALPVTVQPWRSGTDQAVVRLLSNDPAEPSRTVSVFVDGCCP